MEAVAPSEEAIGVLRAIARAGFAYDAVMELVGAAGWVIIDDEPALGYVKCAMELAAGSSVERTVSVLVPANDKPPCALLPLFYFEGYAKGREPFDLAFQTLVEQLARFLGVASRSGRYSYPHRVGWPYSFAGWIMTDATLVLVQDEFDIQFGMDVTLWVQPAGTPIQAPVKYE